MKLKYTYAPNTLKHIGPEEVGVISLEKARKYGPLHIQETIQGEIDRGKYTSTHGMVWCVLCGQSFVGGNSKNITRHKLKHCREHQVLDPGNMDKLRASCTRAFGVFHPTQPL